MSGFLTNLVNRATRTAPVLERRRPAIFEFQIAAPRLAPDPGLLEFDERVEAPTPPRGREAAGRLPAPVQAPVEVGPATPYKINLLPAAPEPGRRVTPDPSTTELTAPPPPPRAQVRSLREPEPSTRIERTTIVEKTTFLPPPPVAANPTTRPVPALRLGTERKPATPSPVPVIAPTPVALRPLEPATDRRNSAGPASTETMRVVPQPLAPLRRTEPPAGLAVQIARASSMAIETAGPEIHVNIGRVEIRAVSEPAKAARRRAPNNPKLTLADYLGSGEVGR